MGFGTPGDLHNLKIQVSSGPKANFRRWRFVRQCSESLTNLNACCHVDAYSGASVGDTMLGIVGSYARVALNPFVVLEQLWREAVGQVGRHMIECSGLKVAKPNEDLKIRDG